jgi:epoxyqueuosine reductase
MESMTIKTKKIDYYKESIKEYKEIKSIEGNKKPKLLLHVCCGACSCYPLIFLEDLFDITIFFSNSNIYPKEEFDKRLLAVKKYKEIVEKNFSNSIKIVVDDYNYDEFKKDLIPYGDEPEGENRCKICIAKRMKRLFEYASKNNYEYVTTVMSISRNKDEQYINQIGLNFSKSFANVYYFVSDFKKNGGQDIGVKLSKKYDVYRQDYCGCEFSKKYEN